ncbi:MAG: hypothetical protein K6T55_07985, partial [Syntrophobacterales bacterium]|nr:hypothetical protein [Syntrophobacterales bacterium]
LEVIEPGAEFWGTLTVELPPEEVRRSPKNKIRHFIAALDLWAAARTFYQQEKEKEDQALFEIGRAPLPLPEGDGLTPLRLGRHSGAECVTIAGHRKIKIKQAEGQPPKILDHATTLWLAADFHQRGKRHQAKLRPFGWALLAQLTAAELGELTARETHWQEAREKTSAGTPPRPTPEIRPTPSPPRPPVVKMEVWEGARISWNPGKGEVTAEWQGKRAFGKGRELVPEALHKKVVTQKKSATARVTVDPEGFRILKIEAE